MKKIGLLFGNEMDFAQAIMERICDKNVPEITVESMKIGILDTSEKPDYSVVLDRFSHCVPFYKSVLRYYKHCGVKIVNDPDIRIADEEFSYLNVLNNLKINIPKTAIFPSKQLPYGVDGNDLHNLQYPLDWESMFKKIGFPANVKSNNSSEFYDCFRIYNKNDFHFIYDMSGNNTLVLQECIETNNNFRLFVIGEKRIFLTYELHKPPKDRYSVADFQFDKKIENEIDKIIKTINEQYAIDMYILDIAVTDKVYVLNVALFSMNINNLIIPQNCYEWMVEEIANLLIFQAINSDKNAKSTVRKATKENTEKTDTVPKTRRTRTTKSTDSTKE